MKRDKQMVYDGIDFGIAKDDSVISASYIFFRREHAQEIGKTTSIWSVHEKSNPHSTALGQVRWFSRWRKYSFFVSSSTVFEETCLREIAYFCEAATDWHKNWKKQKTAASTA